MQNNGGSDAAARPKTALILTGGGARAAYQAGVLSALSHLLPRGSPTPFPVICGTSAGSVNATVLAVDAANFRFAVRRLVAVWNNFHVDHVYRADLYGALRNSARWVLAALTRGRFLTRRPISLLDNAPLAALLLRHINFAAIQRQIDAGHLDALSITCSGYSSGHSVSFYQGRPELRNWQRARRIGVAMPIGLNHLLASSALPFIFPPTHINREYFGDGSMRQTAPISPAIHLGADRVLVIGAARLALGTLHADHTGSQYLYPALAQIAGHAMASIFLDALAGDIERLRRVNSTLALIPEAERARSGLRPVELLVIAPSRRLDTLATPYVKGLPRTVRTILRVLGATGRRGSGLASYLLFERRYTRRLIELGRCDALERADEVRRFFGLESRPAPASPDIQVATPDIQVARPATQVATPAT